MTWCLGNPLLSYVTLFSSVIKTWLGENSTCIPYKLKVNGAEGLALSLCYKLKLSRNSEHVLLQEKVCTVQRDTAYLCA